MADLRNILVATDLSARSDRAMARALNIAVEHGAKVTALSVVDDAMPRDLVDPLLTRIKARLVDMPKAQGVDVDFTPKVIVGDPTETILTETSTMAPDLLVLGTHRPRPFLDSLRETTMQRIVRRTDTSVLLARDPAHRAYDAIDIACDFSPAATAGLRLAQQIAPQAGLTPIHVVYIPYQGMLGDVADHSSALKKTFLAEAKRYDTEWRNNTELPDGVKTTEFAVGSAFGVLAERARRDTCQMITAGAHGRVGASPAILGSLASDLMRDPPCDVLIARP